MTQVKPTPTQEALIGAFFYNPKGWLERGGKRAGCLTDKGYRRISYKNRQYKEHRLVWKMHYGVDPQLELDHINEDKTDNRIENLREVTTGFNTRRARRSKQGLPAGVCLDKRTGRYQSQIYRNGRREHLGMFATAQEAAEVYQRELNR